MSKSQRIFLFLSLLSYCLTPFLLWGQEVPAQGLASITPQEMKAHVYYLASDDMRGRNTPSPELDTCAAYIARQFASDGLQPVGPENTYFQPFYVLKARLSEPNSLTVTTTRGETSYQIKDDFVPLHFTANQKVTAPIVFAGYGITAPEYDYDDYSTVDAQGKIVLVFTHEPQERDTASVFEGRRPSDHSNLRMKIENAIDHGAVGLLLVHTPLHRFRRPPNPWPSLMRHAGGANVPPILEEKAEHKIVCMQIGKQLAQDLLEETGYTLEEIHQVIDETLTPHSFQIPEKTVTMETTLDAERSVTQNVVGLWEGADPDLKDEFVVIGAHYDHVGVHGDSVYNGADDNASGTAGVLEIAQAFTQSNTRPKRSVLFITFAGEEKGLFGSRHYTNDPIFPLPNTVAMFNMDMISRNDTNEVAIIGSPTSSNLKAINEKANQALEMKLDYEQEEWFLQSDHYPFYRKNIPVLFYNSKDTPDLHRPSDDPEKIIPEKMAKIGKLVFSTAWIVANQTQKPDFKRVR